MCYETERATIFKTTLKQNVGERILLYEEAT